MVMGSFIVGGVLASLLGTYMIYLGWQRSQTSRSVAGWLAVLAGIAAFIPAVGIEFALTIGLSLPAIGVWLGIRQEAHQQRTARVISKAPHQWQFNWAAVVTNTWHTLYVLPVLLFACGVTVIALVYQLPVSEPKQMAIGVTAMPVLWGVVAYFYMMSARKVRHVLGCLLLAGLAAVYLFGVSHG
ncbi:hypothetical protein [Alteromonas gilva]|uniref:Uncharacterized protein n=1 Tax=Alteromonas gilva TaxID=2987522 RepID=A0ABT5KYL5_9ALTE|nr:hypothetical protein [Alteromonas gilva]MDC8829269.1 hypothetical protein [Alteromonas gilva]